MGVGIGCDLTINMNKRHYYMPVDQSVPVTLIHTIERTPNLGFVLYLSFFSGIVSKTKRKTAHIRGYKTFHLRIHKIKQNLLKTRISKTDNL